MEERNDHVEAIEKYPSADILYQLSSREFDAEYDRMRLLDNKARLLVTVFFSVFTVFITTIDFSLFFTNKDFWWYVYILFNLGSYAICIASAVLLFKSLGLKKYQRMNPSKFVCEGIAVKDSDEIAFYTGKALANFCTYNQKINDEKATHYRRALVWTFITIIVLGGTLLLSNILSSREAITCAKTPIQSKPIIIQVFRK